MKIFIGLAVLCHTVAVCSAQKKDTSGVKELRVIQVVGYRSMNGMGHLNEIQSPIIYSGKKTEVIEVDSVDANKAINNTRQILGRIPGLNIVESETGGFVANGIGIRGLNPAQSLEMNVRQNGYNIAADVYGYNETYYLPPMEAVQRVEVVKGASSLQFGSQLGGMVNYVIKEGRRDKPFTFSTMQTTGSFGLFNSYNAVGGTLGKWNYFGFLNYRHLDGWRENSRQQQFTGFGKIGYRFNEKLSLTVEYSLLRNKVKMPGGLTDDQFEENSKASVRSRNWLKSPWNIIAATVDYAITGSTSLQIKSTFLSGERSLVWLSELPDEPDAKDSVTGEYAQREVDRELMKSSATEIRLMHRYQLGIIKNTVAAGTRFSFAKFQRMEAAPGTNKSDFDLTTEGEYEEQFKFTTINAAIFMENRVQVSDRFSITPGIRFESLSTAAEGEFEVGGVEKETEEVKKRNFVLLGVGSQYRTGETSEMYVNISQAYRPIDYAQLFPLGAASKVDPDMKDPHGWNGDIGIRGTVNKILDYDFGIFYINYSNRIGTILKTDEGGAPYTFRTNIAKSVHQGIESYLELNITKWLGAATKAGNLSIYNSFGYTDASYTQGTYKGKRVEYAPEFINRVGLTYSRKWITSSIQLSQQSAAYGDAANTKNSENPIVGAIPAYGLIDWSMTLRCNRFKLKTGINNLADKHYLTQRTDEYPGPGIIPSIGRSFYVGLGLNVF